MIAAIAIFAFLVQPQTIPPVIVSGADVVRVCSSSVSDDLFHCYAYISGVNDAALDIYDAADTRAYCVPDHLGVGRVAEEVVQHITANRDLWSARGGGAVIKSLMVLYPCQG